MWIEVLLRKCNVLHVWVPCFDKHSSNSFYDTIQDCSQKKYLNIKWLGFTDINENNILGIYCLLAWEIHE